MIEAQSLSLTHERLVRAQEALDRFGELKSVWPILDEYLLPHSDRPLALGVSGGGDSIALLYLLALWVKRGAKRGARRELAVFNVDHGLNPDAEQWSNLVEKHCLDLNISYQTLKWLGDKPVSGIQAKARLARHRLLANAARQTGARVLLLGHNQDDAIEAEIMREMGSNLGTAKLWSASPVWPQGRDVFVFRPLIGFTRKILRQWLASFGADYIDDPANDDPKYLRSRVRQIVSEPRSAKSQTAQHDDLDLSDLLYRFEEFSALGVIAFNRRRLRQLPRPVCAKLLSAAMVSAGGGEKLPRSQSLNTLVTAINDPSNPIMTLAGARLSADDEHIYIMRNIAERARKNLPLDTLVRADETVVWDGRFEITANMDMVISAFSHQDLEAVDLREKALKKLSLSLRKGLPIGCRLDFSASLQTSLNPFRLYEGENAHYTCRALVKRRFLAACGVIKHEAQIMS